LYILCRRWIGITTNQTDDVFNQDIKPQANGDLSIGRTVKHAKFGFGTVLNFEGDGESARVQVKFKTAGTKWLISAYANLEFQCKKRFIANDMVSFFMARVMPT
jgi:DNA helicase-2/ATP-dependent DNA helicase PcrA